MTPTTQEGRNITPALQGEAESMNDDKGKWVPDNEVNPLTNIFGRRWRVVHMNGAVTTGTYFGDGSGPPYRSAAEWWFDK